MWNLVESPIPTDSWIFFHYRTFPFRLSFSRPRGGVDVPGALEVDVFLHSDEVGRKLPHVLAVVYNADHGVAAGEEVSAERGGVIGVEGPRVKITIPSRAADLLWQGFQTATISSVQFFVCKRLEEIVKMRVFQ